MNLSPEGFHPFHEIGFTDLMRGMLSPAASRIDWIEVYARPVKRAK